MIYDSNIEKRILVSSHPDPFFPLSSFSFFLFLFISFSSSSLFLSPSILFHKAREAERIRKEGFSSCFFSFSLLYFFLSFFLPLFPSLGRIASLNQVLDEKKISSHPLFLTFSLSREKKNNEIKIH